MAQVVDLLPGALLAERFVVRRRLGSGATGTVFEALDTAIGQKVVELYYLSWPRVNIETYHNAWQHALVQPPRDDLGDVYLSIHVSQNVRRRVVDTTGVRWGIRDVFLDRHLAPVLAQWEPSVAEALKVDPTDPSMQALLETRYWDGEHWQIEPAPIRNE